MRLKTRELEGKVEVLLAAHWTVATSFDVDPTTAEPMVILWICDEIDWGFVGLIALDRHELLLLLSVGE